MQNLNIWRNIFHKYTIQVPLDSISTTYYISKFYLLSCLSMEVYGYHSREG